MVQVNESSGGYLPSVHKASFGSGQGLRTWWQRGLEAWPWKGPALGCPWHKEPPGGWVWRRSRLSVPWVSWVFLWSYYQWFCSESSLGLECVVRDSGRPMVYPWHFQSEQPWADAVKKQLKVSGCKIGVKGSLPAYCCGNEIPSLGKPSN